MGTKANPAPFDCYANADDDEPMFILLARDALASELVRTWAHRRVINGKNQSDDPQIIEALQCADAMDAWRETA